MDAIKVAIETILVGALTLPILYLVMELFVPASQARTDWLKRECAGAKAESIITILFLSSLMCSGPLSLASPKIFLMIVTTS